MENTQEDRIALIREAYINSNAIAPKQSVEDFVADIKSEEVFAEHGLLDAQDEDLEDEASLIEYDPSAESIDEEDEEMGLSDEMKGIYS
tara:strand:+ start:4742 stop:5008 length:267 start_codon:yes stop_codon:yes gene_type:complete